MDKHTTIEELKKMGLAPQKMFGQNFLVSPSISGTITKVVIEDKSDLIYEVGPGLGALSDFLVASSKTVKLVEIDHGLANYLKEKYKEKSNVEVIDSDVLKIKFDETRLSVVSNLPYYITTAIIEKIILENLNMINFVFMVQKELSERLFATPKSKEYGPLTILLTLAGETKHLINVDRSAFYPVPNVNSSVYVFKLKEHGLDLTKLYKFIKSLFLMRRKTIYNNLYPLVKDKVLAEKIILSSGLSLKQRPEELSAQDFVELYNHFLALTK